MPWETHGRPAPSAGAPLLPQPSRQGVLRKHGGAWERPRGARRSGRVHVSPRRSAVNTLLSFQNLAIVSGREACYRAPQEQRLRADGAGILWDGVRKSTRRVRGGWFQRGPNMQPGSRAPCPSCPTTLAPGVRASGFHGLLEPLPFHGRSTGQEGAQRKRQEVPSRLAVGVWKARELHTGLSWDPAPPGGGVAPR